MNTYSYLSLILILKYPIYKWILSNCLANRKYAPKGTTLINLLNVDLDQSFQFSISIDSRVIILSNAITCALDLNLMFLHALIYTGFENALRSPETRGADYYFTQYSVLAVRSTTYYRKCAKIIHSFNHNQATDEKPIITVSSTVFASLWFGLQWPFTLIIALIVCHVWPPVNTWPLRQLHMSQQLWLAI